ncbi:hypothetical protein GGI00_001626 [Coemansia sp. RSA 2681]|nr:hypothetical protein GGI00_001626 [Coemansia sp. RSA 2681]
MASEWSAVCLPELLSTVVPPECVIVDDNIAAAECCDHPDFDATVASPVAPSFTKILVKKRNPDDVDSKRRASTRAGSAQPSTMDAALEAGLPADGAGSSVEDPVATDAAMTRLSPSSGVDACCEKLAAVSVGGRTKTIEQRQAEYERARAEIFQDESPPPTSATAQQSAAAASRSSSPPATPAQPQQ